MGVKGLLAEFMADNNMQQLIKGPTHGNNTLNLVLVSGVITSSICVGQPPIADSDHDSQLIFTPIITSRHKRGEQQMIHKMDISALHAVLLHANWQQLLSEACNVNDYAAAFKRFLDDCIVSTSYTQRRRPTNKNLSRDVIKLAYHKREMYRKDDMMGD